MSAKDNIFAYLGYVNFTLNANPPNPVHIVDLRQLYNKLNILSVFNRKHHFLKSLTINQVEVCSSSRGCTPKTFNINKKHRNYLTVYKNALRKIETNKSNNNSKYVLLNIKGTCRIGDVEENISIRIPKSGVVGIKIGLSRQNQLLVNDIDVDKKIHLTLLYEVESLFYKLFTNIGVPPIRKGVISGMSVHGFNLHNLSTGNKPNFRIKNFLQSMTLLGDNMKKHYFDYEPSEGKSVVRANFKPIEKGTDATFGITKWLSVDFSGVKSIHNLRLLCLYIKKIYDKKVLPTITWNTNFEGNPPKSRRKKIQQVNKTKQKNVSNISIPTWNTSKKKFIKNGKVFNCMLMNKKEVSALAVKLDINDNGFKKEVCERINQKLNKI